MERDSGLVRMILEHLEATVSLEQPAFSSQLEFPGYLPEQVNHHISLCHQEGLFEIHDRSAFGEPDFLIRGLSALGRNELVRLRNEDSLTSGLRQFARSVPPQIWWLAGIGVFILALLIFLRGN